MKTDVFSEMFDQFDPFKCRHDGIGLPGCFTCDFDRTRVVAAARWKIAKLEAQLAARVERDGMDWARAWAKNDAANDERRMEVARRMNAQRDEEIAEARELLGIDPHHGSPR